MPIPVTCACGAQFKVPEGAAGKKVKCPKCAAILPVPAAAEAPAPMDEAALPAESPAAPAEKPCPFCAETIQAAAKICPFCKTDLGRPGTRRPARADDEAQRDLKMEAHLRAIAIWYRIAGILMALVGLIIVVAMPAMGGQMGAGGAGCAVGILIVLVLIGAGCYALGHFLWKYSNTARIVTGVFTILGMVSNVLQLVGGAAGAGRSGEAGSNILGALVGLAWGAAYLWALFNGRSAAICTPEYVSRVARTPHLKPATFASPFFWLPFVLCGIGFILGMVLAMAGGASRGF